MEQNGYAHRQIPKCVEIHFFGKAMCMFAGRVFFDVKLRRFFSYMEVF